MRKIRSKTEKPMRPWDTTRITEEKGLKKDYGLRRKREIRVAEEILRNFRRRARELIAVEDKRKEQILIDKLVKIGLLEKGAGLDDVLALEVRNILDRRLQTVIFKKGLASTPKQARQFLIHGHIVIDGRRTTSPAMVLDIEKEGKIKWRKGPIGKEEKKPMPKPKPKAEGGAPKTEGAPKAKAPAEAPQEEKNASEEK